MRIEKRIYFSDINLFYIITYHLNMYHGVWYFLFKKIVVGPFLHEIYDLVLI